MFWILFLFLFLNLYLCVFLFKQPAKLGMIVQFTEPFDLEEKWVEHYRNHGIDHIIILYTFHKHQMPHHTNSFHSFYKIKSNDSHLWIQSFHKKFKWILILPPNVYLEIKPFPSLRDYLNVIEYSYPSIKCLTFPNISYSNVYLYQSSHFQFVSRPTSTHHQIFHSDIIQIFSTPPFKKEKKPHLVITRYKECLKFIDMYPFIFNHIDTIFIYNKGQNLLKPIQRNKVHIISSKNVGDGEETIFRFILDHYHETDMTVIFSSASLFCYPWDLKLKYFLFTLDRCSITNDSILIIHPHEKSVTQNFEMKQYRQIGFQNQESNFKSLNRCIYHPLRVWFEKVLQLPFDKMEFISYFSIFAIHSNDWKKRPFQFYQTIHQRLLHSRYLEENHYLERTWAYLFQFENTKTLFFDNHYIYLSNIDIRQLLFC